MTTDVVPIAIEPPGMQAVGSSVLPKNGIYPTNFCSSKGFPAAIDAFMDFGALVGDSDWVTTIN